MRRIPDCHPEKRHGGGGLCSTCYARKRRGLATAPATVKKVYPGWTPLEPCSCELGSPDSQQRARDRAAGISLPDIAAMNKRYEAIAGHLSFDSDPVASWTPMIPSSTELDAYEPEDLSGDQEGAAA